MNQKFELTEKEIRALKLLNNEISEEITKKIIVNAVKQLIVKGPGKLIINSFILPSINLKFSYQTFLAIATRSDGIYETHKSSEIKLADFAVCTVLLLSAKHSVDALTLKQILELNKIETKTIEQLAESFDKFGDEIHSRLSRLGNSHELDELTNISVKAQYVNNADELIYKIRLQSFDHEIGKRRNIQEFCCNQQELQSLINKLKDIERHCERLTKLSF